MTDQWQLPATPGQISGAHLWDRIVEAKKYLTPIQSHYRAVFEDDRRFDEPVSVHVPDPNWMAMAMHGGIVPTIDVYHKMPLRTVFTRDGFQTARADNSIVIPFTEVGLSGIPADAMKVAVDSHGIDAPDVIYVLQQMGWEYQGQRVLPGHQLHGPSVMPAMTEEEALSYLCEKDIPRHVWANYESNRRSIVLCTVDQIPTDRTLRNAWELTQ